MKVVCKACQYTSDIHKETIEKELNRLKASKTSMADDAAYEARLKICSDCKHLDVSGTCMMCGCYVMLRTALKDNKCPKKYW
ncbi:MAG: hypothetical protein IJ297_06720 [Clostridia bacterium]|nr:hypothetical protein [Clostridia bacterium]